MKLNIRNKLLLAFAAVVLLTGVIGYIGYDSANRINTMSTTMYDNQLQAIIHVKNADIALHKIKVAVRSSMLTVDLQLTQEQVQATEDNEASFEKEMSSFEQLIVTDQARQSYQQAMKDYAGYK